MSDQIDPVVLATRALAENMLAKLDGEASLLNLNQDHKPLMVLSPDWASCPLGPPRPAAPPVRPSHYLYTLLDPAGRMVSRIDAGLQQHALAGLVELFGSVIHHDGTRWALSGGYEIISEPTPIDPVIVERCWHRPRVRAYTMDDGTVVTVSKRQAKARLAAGLPVDITGG